MLIWQEINTCKKTRKKVMAAEYFTDLKPKLVVLGLGTGKPVSS